ncbi:MAG: homocysteine S-methyltransferase family protein [Bacillota bacterium]|nr:homocysteine S-methyltransferase family protein [Bacillota bacterium]
MRPAQPEVQRRLARLWYPRLGRQVLLFDGAMGTELQRRGLPPGACPELWNLEAPHLVREVHQAYREAGAQILETNTFGANRFRLREYGLAERVAELNFRGVALAREVAGEEVLVAGSMGPTGQFLRPFGPLSFDEAYEVFAEQARALAEGGADLLLLETFSDLGEVRAALLAAREAADLPVLVQLTFDESGRTVTGVAPEAAVAVLEALGAAAVGANCSTGPEAMVRIVQAMARAAALPVSAQPNAGLPRMEGGRAVYPLAPEEMAECGLRLVEAGAALVGGCCGTTPRHISALGRRLEGQPVARRAGAGAAGEEAGAGGGPEAPRFSGPVVPPVRLASRGQLVLVGSGQLPVAVGERLNPTARRRLAEELRSGRMSLVREEARRQAEAGAQVLDVNAGLPGIYEAATLAEMVEAIQAVADLPLSLDTADPRALEAGLRSFPGRALINSVTGEVRRLEEVLPLARRYGAAVLGLTLDERGIPPRAEERLQVAERILEAALAAGLRPEDLVIDCLVLAAGAQQREAAETIRAVRLVKERLGLATLLGISNVSHGLPNRPLLNATFLAMALGAGLDAALLNPYDPGVMAVLQAGAVLAGRDQHARRYLAAQAAEGAPFLPGEAAPGAGGAGARTGAARGDEGAQVAEDLRPLWRAILEGDRSAVEGAVEAALAGGRAPLAIIEGAVVPALDEVGRRYERGVYFLPQLMLAAESAQLAFARLRRELQGEGGPVRGTVVLATVKGDIHDIGKNIVGVMLSNHGFQVVDLGKDVPLERILAAAASERADIVGLSALMTTTMAEMRRVVEEIRRRGLAVRVMVGGAVVTPQFAREIGADAYGKDAVAAVQQALRLVQAERGRREQE